MLGLVLGNLAGIMISLPLFDADYETMVNAFVDPAAYPDSRRALLIVQACSSLFGFILAPLTFYVLIEKGRPDKLLHNERIDTGLILLVGLIVLTFMVANSVVIEWNMNVDLSKLSPAFERWATAKEEQLKVLTEYLTRFESIGGLLVGLMAASAPEILGVGYEATATALAALRALWAPKVLSHRSRCSPPGRRNSTRVRACSSAPGSRPS